jgi:hypothetical protein
MYVIEIHNFDRQASVTRITARSPHEAYMAVLGRLSDRCRVQVFDRDEQASKSEFYLWMMDGRARVRIDDQKEWFAEDPSVDPSDEAAPVEFQDGEGPPFTVPFRGTVNRDRALVALADWLDGGERTALLSWA